MLRRALWWGEAGNPLFMASTPSARVINEAVNTEHGSTELSSSSRRYQAYPVTKLLGPLLLITSISLVAGLAPYVAVRRQIMHNRRLLSEIQGEISRGNSRLQEIMTKAEIEASARRFHEQKLGVELDLRLKHLENKHHDVTATSDHHKIVLRKLQNDLEAVNTRCQEVENLVEDIGQRVGDELSGFAAHIEEEQTKRGEGDRTGLIRWMRTLALQLQSWGKKTTTRDSES